jgi:hypothetical protein
VTAITKLTIGTGIPGPWLTAPDRPAGGKIGWKVSFGSKPLRLRTS